MRQRSGITADSDSFSHDGPGKHHTNSGSKPGALRVHNILRDCSKAEGQPEGAARAAAAAPARAARAVPLPFAASLQVPLRKWPKI